MQPDKDDKYFMEIDGLGDDQAFCKPEPTGIWRILSRLNAQKETSILVGDSEVDLLAAKRAGIVPVLIDRESDTKRSFDEVKPEEFIQISSLLELNSL